MITKFAEVAYELDWELDHFEDFHIKDWSHDLVIEPFPGMKRAEIDEIEPFPHPNPVIYTAYRDITDYIDYPYTNNGWPVMSKRMYEALLSVGHFPHRIIPVAVIDWRILEEWYDAQGKLRDEITNWNYVAVQLTEHADVFDWEKAVYQADPDMPERPGSVSQYAFRVPPGGLPPLFRIKNHSVRLFVSAEARAALKAAGVCGTQYISLRGYHIQDEPDVDVPIVVPGYPR
jgi:hypothetical protein